MQLQSAILPLAIGLIAYCLALVIHLGNPGFQVQAIPYLPTVMYLAVALGLYLNVSDIDIPELQKNKLTIAAVLFLGVPVKIFLPGLVLLDLLPSLGKTAALLCATVIAQIDPILSAKNIAHDRFSTKSGTILRCWSSFDDPITVLFAFYIFIPVLFRGESSYLSQFLTDISFEGMACIIMIAVFHYRTQLPIFAQESVNKILVIAVCIASGLAGRFLLPASMGLISRPFSTRVKEQLLNWIFGFSAFVIGALAVDIPLNWTAGIVLGGMTFFIAQPLIAWLFIRDTWENLFRVMLGHQNGVTAILLTIALELQIGQEKLLSITLPAIVAIAFFYAITNYLLEQHYLSNSL